VNEGGILKAAAAAAAAAVAAAAAFMSVYIMSTVICFA